MIRPFSATSVIDNVPLVGAPMPTSQASAMTARKRPSGLVQSTELFQGEIGSGM
jgi:hypothetical protein